MRHWRGATPSSQASRASVRRSVEINGLFSVALSAERLQDGVRRLLQRLRPAELDELGLVAATQSMVAAWRSRSGVRFTVIHRGAVNAIGDDEASAVYRVVQEALTNVVQHAQARTVTVLLAVDGDVLVARVDDDGTGFDVRDHRSAAGHGIGLLGARERAAAVGGVLEIASAPGSGTSLELRIPLGCTIHSLA